MLTTIHIRNFVLVEELSLDIQTGLTVLTGETGAGKSILIDALSLALGAKADTSVIRANAKKAEVSLHFDIQRFPAIQDWLSQYDFDNQEEECVLRRVISQDARSRAYINARPVPLQRLKELGQSLIDIHGQHAQHGLLDPSTHLSVVDNYGGHEALSLQVKQAYKRWRETNDALSSLKLASQERQARMEFCQFQIDELTELALSQDEWPALNDKQKRLAQSGDLMATTESLLSQLSESEQFNTLESLQQASQTLKDLTQRDVTFETSRDLVENALIHTEEAINELKQALQQLDCDPDSLINIEQRLSDIHTLARKHRTTPEQLPELLQRLQSEWHDLNAQDENIENLSQTLKKWHEKYIDAAKKLSKKRAQSANALSQLVTTHCRALGMPEASFLVSLEQDDDCFSLRGFDKATFLIAPNPGLVERPLHKVASGGEIARVSLAIELANQQNRQKPVMIFDEVDVGIGGGVADIVGRCLHQLSKSIQVFCVTHLAQVAAHADNHLYIKKVKENATTHTQCQMLSAKQRVDEIARMIGGVKITNKTRAHAKEMLKQGKKPELA